jgi:hypothetical protein
MTNHSNRLLEKPLGGFHIPPFAQHGVNQIALVVDRPIHITPLPMYFEVGFINIPGSPCLPTPLAS